MNTMDAIPENQLDIFEMLETMEEETITAFFDKEKANWHPNPVVLQELQCSVVGIIPEDVLEPRERPYTDNDWGDQQDTWSAYVWSIAQMIPYPDRAKDDINGWLAAMKIFVDKRNKREPIRLEIPENWADKFNGLEVIEYL